MRFKTKDALLTLFVLLLVGVGIAMIAGFLALFGDYWQWAGGAIIFLTFLGIALFLIYKDR